MKTQSVKAAVLAPALLALCGLGGACSADDNATPAGGSGGAGGGGDGGASASVGGDGGNEPGIATEYITTDTTWRASDGIKLVKNRIIVAGPTNPTLTIEPGVIVRFAKGAELEIGSSEHLGRLDASGSAASGILFEADGSNPAPGDWGGITFERGGDGSKIQHATLKHCGRANGRSEACITEVSNAPACPEATHCAGPELQALVIQRSKNRGIEIQGPSEFKFRSGVVPIRIEDSGGYPVAVDINLISAIPSLRLELARNAYDAVLLTGDELSSDLKDGQPQRKYLYPPEPPTIPFDIENDLTIRDALQIPEGTILRFAAGAGMTIENRGSLFSIGAGPAPTTFTARDPNPTPGIWKGLTIRKGAGAKLGNVLIEYGGGPTGANLTVQNDFTSVVDSEFRHSAGCGVRLPSAPTPGNPLYDDLSGGVDPSSASKFTNNAGGNICGP